MISYSKEQAEKLTSLVKERNKIAHLYEEITPKRIFDIVGELPEIEQFLKTIKKRIQQAKNDVRI